MLVTRVRVRDFRNYERIDLDLGHGLTVVSGQNGAGKTNLLEAVYFGLTARSARTTNEREVIRHGAALTRVALTTSSADAEHELEVGFEPGQPKRLRLDGSVPDAFTVGEARPPVSVFLPERLELVKGAPAHRRAHLDRFVAAVWPARSSTRAAYGRALAQRNALLGRIRAGAAREESLATWDAEFARHGAALMADRREAVEQLASHFERRAGELGLSSSAELRYRPRSHAQDARGLVEELSGRREEDLARGFTSHGPHRDDLLLLHSGRALRAFGSQGQQRVGVLALLFGERDVLAACSRPPLMLLDDVMSELDPERRERLTNLLREGGQAIVTATDLEHVPGARDSAIATLAVADGVLRATPRSLAA